VGEAAWVATWVMVAVTATVLLGDPGDLYLSPDEDLGTTFSLPVYACALLLSLSVSRWIWLWCRAHPRSGRPIAWALLCGSVAATGLLATRDPLREPMLWILLGFPGWVIARYPGSQRAFLLLLLLARTLGPLIPPLATSLDLLYRRGRRPGTHQNSQGVPSGSPVAHEGRESGGHPPGTSVRPRGAT